MVLRLPRAALFKYYSVKKTSFLDEQKVMFLVIFHVNFKQNGASGRPVLPFFWSLATASPLGIPKECLRNARGVRPAARTVNQTHPITIHNIRKIPPAEGLRPISANATLLHTLWWWLDQAGSTYNKLWTPS